MSAPHQDPGTLAAPRQRSAPDDRVGRRQRRGARRRCPPEDVGRDLADPLDRRQHRFGPVVDPLLVEVDHATRIGQIVRDEDDPPRRQSLRIRRRGKLVVGAAAYQPDAQSGDRAPAQHRAQRARCEHVDRLVVDLLDRDRPRAMGSDRHRRARRIEVGHHEPGTSSREIAAQRQADIAQALHGDLEPGGVASAEAKAGGGHHRRHHPVGGHRERFLRGARGGRGVRRHPADHGQIVECRADIVGDDVAAAEAVDGPAEGLQQGRALVVLGIGKDHRLGAAIGQPADRRLVGHPARQPQHVGQRQRVVRVRVDAAAAEARTEGGADGSPRSP